jgi:RNA polymerase sigma-70 factor, ECF subfamily
MNNTLGSSLPGDHSNGLRAAFKSWPQLAVDEAGFTQFLSERGIDGTSVAPTVAADLYLAFACAAQLPGAHQAFRLAYKPLVTSVCKVMNADSGFAEDVLQRVCEVLFVGTPSRPARIAQYRGQGSLGGWVRTVAKRVALRLCRRGELLMRDGDASLATEIAASYDYDLLLIKSSHREFLKQTIADALRSNPDRRLVQLVFLAGISMAQVGKMYGMSQPTVSRRIRAATSAIFDAVRDATQAQFGLDEQEADSFLALFRSQLDLQVSLCDDSVEASLVSSDAQTK